MKYANLPMSQVASPLTHFTRIQTVRVLAAFL